MRAIQNLTVLLFFSLVLSSCGSDYKKTPIDNLIKELNDVPTYSIILYDMDVEGTFFNTYKQQYQILKNVGDSVQSSITPWREVKEADFLKYKEDMGMTIVSKTNGIVKKGVSPAGYANYVGNPKYGNWSTNSSGGSFWEFYGKYAFMSSMFNLMSYPARRSYYNDYRSNYYSRNRPYYGPTTSNNRKYYGTSGVTNSRRSTTSSWGRRTQGFSSNNSFQNRVNSRTSRSSSNSRSSTRGSSSTYRSRGGGFGK